MSLCKGGNLTLIVKVMGMKGIIDIEGKNRLSGQFGSIMDMLLDTKGERNCTLIGTYEFGIQLPNLTHTGALGLLQEKKGDIFLSPSTQLFLTDFIEQTNAVFIDKYLISHRIEMDRKSKETDIVNLVTDFEESIKVFFIVLSLVFIIVFILISYLSTSVLRIAKLLDNFLLFKSDYRQPLTIIGLMLLFYHLFYFIFKSIISNLITAFKILVDTNYIIDSIEKLLQTKSVICWIKNDVEFRMAEQSPKGSTMLRLFEEKKYSTPELDMEGEMSDFCLLSIKRIGQMFDFTNRVLFINEAALYGFLATFIAPNPEIAYWIFSDPIIETVSVYYYRKGLTDIQKFVIDNKNFLNFISNLLKMQSGLSQYSYDVILYSTQKMIKSITKYYTNLNDFIQDNTQFTNLRFVFLEQIFIMQLMVNVLVLVVFLIRMFAYRFCMRKRNQFQLRTIR